MTRLFFYCFIFPFLLFSQELSKYIPKQFTIVSAPIDSIVPRIFTSGSRSEKRIALTFDACANTYRSKYDSAVIGILIRTRTPATLFISGKWAVEHLKETKFLGQQHLFEIGNHSFIHPHFPQISKSRMNEELQLTQNVLFTLTKKIPKIFRSPYGEINDTIVRSAALFGMTTVAYDLPSGDPDTLVTKQKLIDYVSAKTKNGSVIVMHMNKRGWHTAEALPEIIERLRKRGFVFVTISELMQ
ncbi:MAG: polysaccharide deacetylase family protein [Bacteroidota bacterium]|nr:polysaccharide deacetylase family protein [Bacteroidota bacterium]